MYLIKFVDYIWMKYFNLQNIVMPSISLNKIKNIGQYKGKNLFLALVSKVKYNKLIQATHPLYHFIINLQINIILH